MLLPRRSMLPALLLLLLPQHHGVAAANTSLVWQSALGQSVLTSTSSLSLPPALLARPPPPDDDGKCPPCFNCQLPSFSCAQFGKCSEYDGSCACPTGWGGQDCLSPLCSDPTRGNSARFPRPPNANSCKCSDGWAGLNCNVCQRDDACAGFALGGDLLGDEGVCFTGGQTVRQSFQQCDVTNSRITDMLPGRPPQVTFSCAKDDKECNFQFWIGGQESFYCALSDCDEDTTEQAFGPGAAASLTTRYSCSKVQCKCVPGRMLCGENGSIDIHEFLDQEIKGPGKMTCKSKPLAPALFSGSASKNDSKAPPHLPPSRDCRFEEPAMNDLISSVFGDPSISLSCSSGECMHYSQVPGYAKPPSNDDDIIHRAPIFWVIFSAAGAIFVVILASVLFWALGRKYRAEDSGDPQGFFQRVAARAAGKRKGRVQLPEEEAAKLMQDHVPAALHFINVGYKIGSSGSTPTPGVEEVPAAVSSSTKKHNKQILRGVTGGVKPGQLLAIIGASGAGKSTFLDILARRNKRGAVSGLILVNGRQVPDSAFKHISGFVDQEDTLMPTLTVYETILYSALLRLPRDMSFAAKQFRVLETMDELGLLHVRDSRIGDSAAGKRGISGGEKRRVSIACELVTSPSVLFLDEPTSGLDASNAYNVIESLSALARDFNRTVVFTIHQPRSNIVGLFDQILLLSQGRAVYSGPFDECVPFLRSIGKPCPDGFNVADYLIDLTAAAAAGDSGPPSASRSRFNSVSRSSAGALALALQHREALKASSVASSASTRRDEESGLPVPATAADESSSRPGGSRASVASSVFVQDGADAGDTELRTRQNSAADSPAIGSATPSLSSELLSLVRKYEDSEVFAKVRAEIISYQTRSNQAAAAASGSGIGSESAVPRTSGEDGPEAELSIETRALRGFKKASLFTQLIILSGRAFKNLYRNPMLMLAHYAMAIVLALFCGFLYHGLTNDIAGFQDRLGVFFFILALFGFSTLTSLGIFANERALFVRERANGYYSPVTFFIAKTFFDILPLRIIPPFLFGGVSYFLIGLIPGVPEFWKFILALVLFSLATSSAVFFISVAIKDTGVANLVGSLMMLFSLLFAGLLINRDRIPVGLRWLQHLSFFHAAYEALIVNELRTLTLREHKYGVDIEVPAASIISTFGFVSSSSA
ncbi:FAD-dependent urate hydroxylase [Tilletia horrida]|nr:FAD-dependent urate hydroxylase [Tilletia horrida]